jgi:1-deoxy-D-xylulose-5-phosphate reductoisomerase
LIGKRLFILGSTGSIGQHAIEVVQHLRTIHGTDHWPIVGLAAGQNQSLLTEQAALLGVEAISLQSQYSSVDVRVYCGEDAAAEMIREHARAGDLVLAAIVGFAGISPVLAAIECGCDIALANKESLVAAGELIMAAAKRAGVRILPVDSEHSAIFQCIENSPLKDIAKVVLTASGGSLRSMTKLEMETASIEEVLSHPTWNMGRKVTVDSASLMNKALELIEAHWLFGIDSEKLDAVIHPQSIVHGFVEFSDGSIVAQMSLPDMRLPIQYALTWPSRAEGCIQSIDWNELGSLDFEPVDHDRYPAIQLAHHVIELGGSAGTVLNAANEVVVEAFLTQMLPFGSMGAIVEEVIEKSTISKLTEFGDVQTADRDARVLANELVASVGVNS